MVLVEEANAGGIPRLGCPHEDQDMRLLAGVAKPASVTVCEDSLGSPCVGGRCPLLTLPGGSFWWYLLGYRSDGPYVAGGPVGPYGTLSPSDSDPAGSDPVGRCPSISLIPLARMLQVALLARLGHCPYLTLTLLAPTARMLQGALLAQMGRCPSLSLTLLARMARMLQVTLLARLGNCPHLTLTLLAPTAHMLQGALLAQMGC